jgi:hypothetical protein
MTAGILYMLRLTPAGMEILEFIPNNNLLRFLADTTLPSVKVFHGGVGSRHSSSLKIDSSQRVAFQNYFNINMIKIQVEFELR